MSTKKLLALAILAFPALLAAQPDEVASAPVASIGVSAARDLAAGRDDAIILDVRTPMEYQLSHISGAINADVQDAGFEAMLAKLDPHKTYIVHCTKNPAGGRSSRALQTMQELGFRKLYSLEGGYLAWQEADLPLSAADN